jgi:hypothetical protein
VRIPDGYFVAAVDAGDGNCELKPHVLSASYSDQWYVTPSGNTVVLGSIQYPFNGINTIAVATKATAQVTIPSHVSVFASNPVDGLQEIKAMAWADFVSQVGSQGPKGEKGDAGTPGEKWFSGTGPPPTGTGIPGDWWLDTSTGDVYEQTSTDVWDGRGTFAVPPGRQGLQARIGSRLPDRRTHPWRYS